MPPTPTTPKEPTQICNLADGRLFTLQSDVKTKENITLPAGTELHVTKTSTTKYWIVSDGEKEHEISKLEVGIPL